MFGPPELAHNVVLVYTQAFKFMFNSYLIFISLVLKFYFKVNILKVI